MRGAGNIWAANSTDIWKPWATIYLRLPSRAVSEKGEEASSYELECLVDVQVQAHIPEAISA